MNSNHQLDLAAQLYDAAIDATLWPGLLDRLARDAGAKAAALVVIETLQRYGYSLSVTSTLYSDEVQRRFVAEFARFEEEQFRYIATRPVGEVVFDQQSLLDRDAFRRRPDVAFLEREAGVLERFAMRLNDQKAWFDCVTFQFDVGRGNITEAERERLQTYVPHLAKSIDLSRSFSELKRRYQAVLAVLDRFVIAVALVLPDGQVMIRNESAHALFEQRDALTISVRGELVALDPGADAQLRHAIRHASAVATLQSVGGACKLLVPKRSRRQALLVDVAPIRDARGEIDRNFRGAFVTIIDPDQRLSVSINGLVALYALSEAEAAVVAELVAGRSNADIAAARGVSENTVKTQIAAVLAKTGARNRTELVSQLLAVTLPID